MQLKPHTKHSLAKHDEKNSSTKTDTHTHTPTNQRKQSVKPTATM